MGGYPGSDGISPRVGAFEIQSQARTREIRLQITFDRDGCSIEEHLLDSIMIIEVFDVTGRRRRAASVLVHTGNRVS